MSRPQQGIRLAFMLLAMWLVGCTPMVAELKAARNPHGEALHARLSQSIQENGFSHGIQSIRMDEREVDTIFVSIPLDSLKRQYINLHHMLFNVARICARPEFANVSILIELNAGDESDRAYMRSIVAPLVAEAHNVAIATENGPGSDVVITLSKRPLPRDAGAAAR